MKKIQKGNYVRIEKKGGWAEAYLDGGIIYVSYGEMPYTNDGNATTERIGHFLDNPEKDYPTTTKELAEVLKTIAWD